MTNNQNTPKSDPQHGNSKPAQTPANPQDKPAPAQTPQPQR